MARLQDLTRTTKNEVHYLLQTLRVARHLNDLNVHSSARFRGPGSKHAPRATPLRSNRASSCTTQTRVYAHYQDAFHVRDYTRKQEGKLHVREPSHLRPRVIQIFCTSHPVFLPTIALTSTGDSGAPATVTIATSRPAANYAIGFTEKSIKILEQIAVGRKILPTASRCTSQESYLYLLYLSPPYIVHYTYTGNM